MSDVAQDNSITSEPSETTTTTTTTSEDVVTTYKETSQLSGSNGITAPQTVGGNGNGNGGTGAATGSATGGAGAGAAGSGSAASSAAHKPHNGSAAALATSASAASAAQDEQLSLSLSLSQGADSAPDKSEASDDGDCNGCGNNNNNNNNVANNSADNSQALEDDSIESPSRSHRLGASGAQGLPGLGLGAGSSSGNRRGQLKVESSDVYQIVDALRRNTNLSFDLSCEALRVVLTSLEQLYNGAINPYLEAVAVHVTGKVATPKELLGITHDSKRLQYLFGQLADCKNDTEQRTWMLYEDEEDIIQFLEELVEILVSVQYIYLVCIALAHLLLSLSLSRVQNNADENISCYEMSCDQYQMFINLVQYYQMESRWSIKRLLLKTFTAACHLDHIIVDILLTSVLPLEIVSAKQQELPVLSGLISLYSLFL